MAKFHVSKETATKALSAAHSLATKALGSPDVMAFVDRIASPKSEKDLRASLHQLCDRYEKSLPDLRVGAPDRAAERECMVREIRLVLSGDLLTSDKK